ncbi:hypothetical protein F4776DRAFT_662699 [Hypoxylon sp. NC0597]|nr:hypothetical protein F4776DRAFT_662699 [Hypoxylon sp. NC0597]
MTQSEARGHYYQLHKLLVGDVAAAAISATFVTPAIVIIDRAVVEKVASHQPFLRTLWSHTKFAVTRPRRFVFSRPFGILWTLYASTFTAANTSETVVKYWKPAAAGAVTFVATVLVNTPLGIWKDLQFARIYGGSRANETLNSKVPVVQHSAKKAITSRVPVGGLSRAPVAVFLLRDSLTLYGAFGA